MLEDEKQERGIVSVHALWAGAVGVVCGAFLVACSEQVQGFIGGGALIALGFKAFQSAIVLESRRVVTLRYPTRKGD